ncbi:hypothetical protein INR49_008854 [Caranx melampygus]|nr:hypothetical protein INR49_008854 [Caranx melampygus]
MHPHPHHPTLHRALTVSHFVPNSGLWWGQVRGQVRGQCCCGTHLLLSPGSVTSPACAGDQLFPPVIFIGLMGGGGTQKQWLLLQQESSRGQQIFIRQKLRTQHSQKGLLLRRVLHSFNPNSSPPPPPPPPPPFSSSTSKLKLNTCCMRLVKMKMSVAPPPSSSSLIISLNGLLKLMPLWVCVCVCGGGGGGGRQQRS